jgi:high-affinity iron transporter
MGVYMVSSMFLAFREGLEAALVIGIILAYLFQTGRKDLAKYVYYGAFLGLVISIVGGFIGFHEAKELGEEGEEIFENVMRLLASGLIAYFIVWVGNQSKSMSSDIKNKVSNNTSSLGLLVLSFLSVFREGMELCVMTLTKISENASDVALGIGVGMILAIILTYIIFKSSVKFNLKLIFKVLGFILIYLGAEMFAEGVLGITELGEEPFEAIFMVLFALPSLYFFLKNDINSLLKKA